MNFMFKLEKTGRWWSWIRIKFSLWLLLHVVNTYADFAQLFAYLCYFKISGGPLGHLVTNDEGLCPTCVF